jgi:hypothetical protein
VGTGSGHALRAAPPIGDVGLVNLISLVVNSRETGCGADRAVDINDAAALPADEVVVVVADAILETCGRSGRLNTSE